MCERCWLVVFFFFFMQKTAYVLRISDWISDVCSSDLRVAAHHSELLLSKLQGTIVRPALRQPLAHVVFTTLARTLDVASLLRSAAPDDYSRERVEDAVTDVIHRALFGIVSDVNARSHGYRPAPELEISDILTRSEEHTSELQSLMRN